MYNNLLRYPLENKQHNEKKLVFPLQKNTVKIRMHFMCKKYLNFLHSRHEAMADVADISNVRCVHLFSIVVCLYLLTQYQDIETEN